VTGHIVAAGGARNMSEPEETVTVAYPAEVRASLGETKEEFARELKMLACYVVDLLTLLPAGCGRRHQPEDVGRRKILGEGVTLLVGWFGR